MAWNTRGPIEVLVSHLQAIGMEAQAGVPRGTPYIVAHVTLGDMGLRLPTFRKSERKTNYYCGFSYSVEDSPADAELNLADLVDAFLTRLETDNTLGGTSAQPIVVNPGAGDRPLYRNISAEEYRTYPVVVTVTQFQDAPQ